MVRDNAGSAEATVTRTTQIQDLEAREIFVETANVEGEMLRGVSWIAVSGPLAVTVSFQAPIANAAELEPLFKSVVQSVMFLPREHTAFEKLRSSALNSGGPGPIHEIESIVASRLGRIKEAMTALEKAIELDPDQAQWIANEPDLKPLAHLPAFKKLVPPPEQK